MKKPNRSQKLFLEKFISYCQKIKDQQRDLEIGQLISLIRKQLRMSQRALAKRSNVPQVTISKIESGNFNPTTATLEKILNALECDLIITAIPRKSLDTILKEQAKIQAQKKINYLKGTMELEDQQPDEEFIKELIDEEIKKLLESSGSGLWEN